MKTACIVAWEERSLVLCLPRMNVPQANQSQRERLQNFSAMLAPVCPHSFVGMELRDEFIVDEEWQQ